MTLVNFVRTRLLIKFPLAAATAAFLIFTGFCARPYVTLQGSTMGTTWTAKFSSADSLENSDVQNIIENKLISLNKVYSTYDPDSELSLLNSAAANEWIKISPALENILLEAVAQFARANKIQHLIMENPGNNAWIVLDNKPRPEAPTNSQAAEHINRAAKEAGFSLGKTAYHYTGSKPDWHLHL